MKDKDLYDEINSIKKIMERSSKFISLSGLSGILAGVYALIGAGLAFYIIYGGSCSTPLFLGLKTGSLNSLIAVATSVLISSLITGYILTSRKAKKKGQPIWGSTSRALLFN